MKHFIKVPPSDYTAQQAAERIINKIDTMELANYRTPHIRWLIRSDILPQLRNVYDLETMEYIREDWERLHPKLFDPREWDKITHIPDYEDRS